MSNGHNLVRREKVISGQTSAATGQNRRAEITEIDGIPIESFDEIFVYVNCTTNLAGTAPKMDILLLRSVVDVPVYATDAHWDAFANVPQITPTDANGILRIPFEASETNGQSVGEAGWKRSIDGTGLGLDSAGDARPGHWGDVIRIDEKMSGTVTTQAVYDVYLTGILRGTP